MNLRWVGRATPGLWAPVSHWIWSVPVHSEPFQNGPCQARAGGTEVSGSGECLLFSALPPSLSPGLGPWGPGGRVFVPGLVYTKSTFSRS